MRLFTSRISRLAPLILIGLLLMTLTACGKKGPVRPKLRSLPAAPEEISLHQRGPTLILSWALPDKNQDGGPAEDLVGFEIRRLSYPAGESCPTCREPEDRVAEISLNFPEPAQRVDKRFLWRDVDVVSGFGYRYAIVPVTLGRQEGAAAYVHRTVQEAPPAPSGLTARAGDRRVELSWNAPPLTEGRQSRGYFLYRRQAPRPFPPVPLNANPLEETTLVDRGLENGIAYEYRVSILVEEDGTVLESLATPGVLVTPQAGR